MVKTLDEIYDPRNRVLRDLKVDDRDMEEFPNFFEFATSKDGLDASLFSRQLYACLMVLAEICPTCSNQKYVKHIKDVPVGMDWSEFPHHFQLMNFGVCPKCGKSKRDHFRNRTLNPYQELAGLAGQRVGKSLIIAALTGYLTHKQLKLQNISKVYKVLNTTVVGTFVGLTYDAAFQQLWLPYSKFIQDSPWFRRYHELLKDMGERYGEELFKFGTQLHYLHRGILVYPSGPNKKTLRGKTRFFGAVDEWDFFNSDTDGGEDQVKMNGNEIYKSLNNSLLTLRVGWKNAVKSGMYSVPNGYQFNVSSPQSISGVLTTHVAKNLESRKVYCFHLATWEMNPMIKKSDLSQEYSDDPEKADRDFGANPPLANSPFIADPNTVIAMQAERPNAVDYVYIQRRNKMGAVRRAAKITTTRLPTNVEPAIMSIDAGFSNNSFSMTLGNRRIMPNGERRVHFPVIVEIIPEKGKNTLDYSKIAEFVMFPLIRTFNVQAVFADRWNSIKLLHDIETEFEIPAEQYSIKYRDFALVRSYMENGGLTIPRFESYKEPGKILKPDMQNYPKMFDYRPIDHFFLQACTVKDTDRDVVKGTKLTDDSWRALCLGAVWLLDDEFCEEHLKGTITVRRGGLGAVANGYGISGTGSFTQHMSQSQIMAMGVGAIANAGMSTFNGTKSLYEIAAGQGSVRPRNKK